MSPSAPNRGSGGPGWLESVRSLFKSDAQWQLAVLVGVGGLLCMLALGGHSPTPSSVPPSPAPPPAPTPSPTPIGGGGGNSGNLWSQIFGGPQPPPAPRPPVIPPQPTAVFISTTVSSSIVGQPVKVTVVDISPNQSGKVWFNANNKTIGPPSQCHGSHADFILNTLPAGRCEVTASFQPDNRAHATGTSNSIVITVDQARVRATLHVNASATGSPGRAPGALYDLSTDLYVEPPAQCVGWSLNGNVTFHYGPSSQNVVVMNSLAILKNVRLKTGDTVSAEFQSTTPNAMSAATTPLTVK